MFTGLVQCIGHVRAVQPRGTGAQITVCAPIATPDDPLILGESIAVNGACLTVTDIHPDGFSAEILEETLRCTTFGKIQPGDRVNLERALKLGDRLGGHLVSGHVDETGCLISCNPEGADKRYRFSCSAAFSRGTIRKGSVTIAGVSLTICAVGDGWFEVALIPTTLRETILGELQLGAAVNLEADLIGAYVRKALGQSELTYDRFIAAGFAD